jgi:hypothetical protein
VVALDAAGNRSEVAFIYTDSGALAGKASSGETAQVRASHLAADLDGAYFHDDFAVVRVSDPRRLLTERGNGEVEADTVRLRAADLAGAVRSLAGVRGHDGAVYVSALRAEEAGSVAFTGLGFEVIHPARALYADAVVFAVGEGGARAGRQRSLTPRSPAVRLGPSRLVLKSPATVRIPVDAPTARDGVFRSLHNGGPWTYLPTRADSAGLSAATDRPGVFAVFRDPTAPWIGKARAVLARSYAGARDVPEIHVPVDDEGSGFDETRSEVWVGGQPRIWRWDFAAKKIVVVLRDETIIEPQLVRVVAFDQVGNSSSADATVTVDARASH